MIRLPSGLPTTIGYYENYYEYTPHDTSASLQYVELISYPVTIFGVVGRT